MTKIDSTCAAKGKRRTAIGREPLYVVSSNGAGLSVFKDDESIRAGELWLDRLQEAVMAMRDSPSSYSIFHGGLTSWIRGRLVTALCIVGAAFTLFQTLGPFLDFSDFVAHCLLLWRHIIAAPWIWLAGLFNIQLPEYIAIGLSLFLFIMGFCIRSYSSVPDITSEALFLTCWTISIVFFALVSILMYLPYGDRGMMTSAVVSALLSIVWICMLTLNYIFVTFNRTLRKIFEELKRVFDDLMPHTEYAARLSAVPITSIEFNERLDCIFQEISEEEKLLVQDTTRKYLKEHLSQTQIIIFRVIGTAVRFRHTRNLVEGANIQPVVYLVWHYAVATAIYMALFFLVGEHRQLVVNVLQAAGLDTRPIANVTFTLIGDFPVTTTGIKEKWLIVLSMVCNVAFCWLAMKSLFEGPFEWVKGFSINETPAFLIKNTQNIVVTIFTIFILLSLNAVSKHSAVIRKWLESVGT